MARKRSGGPRTLEGKARSSRNAIKHGIRSQDPVIPDVELEEVWESHRQWIVESYEVDGAVEQALANRIASLLWRLERVIAYEQETINDRRNSIWDDLASWARLMFIYTKKELEGQELLDRANKLAAIRILPDSDELMKIRRYEAHLHRMLLQTMRQLDMIQARRRNQERSSGRLDIDGELIRHDDSRPRR
jgi:hypothetical protein